MYVNRHEALFSRLGFIYMAEVILRCVRLSLIAVSVKMGYTRSYHQPVSARGSSSRDIRHTTTMISEFLPFEQLGSV